MSTYYFHYYRSRHEPPPLFRKQGRGRSGWLCNTSDFEPKESFIDRRGRFKQSVKLNNIHQRRRHGRPTQAGARR